MKFGRRNSWVEVGRRLLAERFSENDEIIYQEERNAVLQVARQLPEPDMDMQQQDEMEEHASAGDPTQLLLTALGRFNRGVERGEQDPRSEGWTDDCIDQIITGIEIAVQNEWSNVREALTDTARILQTYEDSDIAYESIPFLKDSYEILCLMVGDLIVDNVRSGVMNKWRERYHLAVKELERFGLEPIPDDETDTSASQAMPAQAPARGQIIPFESLTRREEIEEAPQEIEYAEEEVIESELYTEQVSPEIVEDLRYESIESECTEDALVDEAVVEAPLDEVELEDEAETEIDDTPLWSLPQEAEEESAAAAPEARRAQEMFLFEASDIGKDAVEETTTVADIAISAAMDEVEEETVIEVEDEEMNEIAPAIEAVALHVEMEAALAEEEFNAALDAMDRLESEAAVEEVIEEEILAETEIEEVVEEEDQEETLPEESEYTGGAEEFVYPAYTETATQTSLFDLPEEMAASPAPAVAAVAPAPVAASALETPQAAHAPAKGTPEFLLHSAQAAMARGDIASAKLFALQVAADMARIEGERAAGELRMAESAREETQAAINAAQTEVSSAEAGLKARQHARAAQAQALEAKRQEIRGIEGSVHEIERGIAHLDEQIARLSAQREAEAERLAEVQAVDAAERREESRILEEIEVLAGQEITAEQSLRAARTRVAAFEEECRAREAAIGQAAVELAAKTEAVGDIERTMAHVRAVTGV